MKTHLYKANIEDIKRYLRVFGYDKNLEEVLDEILKHPEMTYQVLLEINNKDCVEKMLDTFINTCDYAGRLFWVAVNNKSVSLQRIKEAIEAKQDYFWLFRFKLRFTKEPMEKLKAEAKLHMQEDMLKRAIEDDKFEQDEAAALLDSTLNFIKNDGVTTD